MVLPNNLIEADWRKQVGTRLRRAIEKRYGARHEAQFAKDIGISQGSLSDICRGNTTPSAFTLLKIDQHSTINIMRLLRG